MTSAVLERIDQNLYNSSEHPVSWFRDEYKSGALIIKPPYQRNPVWNPKQRCHLIESILLGLPIPEIYIQHSLSTDDETSFAVVDGQQRIRTLLQFIGVEHDPAETEHNDFPLDELEDGSPWLGLKFETLPPDDRKRFLFYRFGVRYLNTNDEMLVRRIFERLNRYSTSLSPQEVRNARFYTGAFHSLATRLADDEYWVESRITTPAMIRRMKDVEFMSELLIGVLHGPQKGSPGAIDEYYEQYGGYEDEFPDQKRAEQFFKKTLALIQKILPKIRETRWQNRTDFYTLFVCVSGLLQDGNLPLAKHNDLRDVVISFGGKVDKARRGELKKPPNAVEVYLEAAERGANDKKRRADRHAALLSVVGNLFTQKSAFGALRLLTQKSATI